MASMSSESKPCGLAQTLPGTGRAPGGHLASDALYIARCTHRRGAHGRTLEPPYDRVDEMHFPGQVLP